MKKLRITIKRFLLRILKKDIIPFEDCGKPTELHCYRLFGAYIKITQFIKPIEPNNEQCEYLGITCQDRHHLYKRFPLSAYLGYSNRAGVQKF